MSLESRLARRLTRRRNPLPPHGVRARYQIGCRCLPCRLANAEQEVIFRRLRRRRQQAARALVDGKQARAWMRALLAEGFTKQMIRRELGAADFRGVGQMVTYARHLGLARLYFTRVADPAECMCVTEYPASNTERSRADART